MYIQFKSLHDWVNLDNLITLDSKGDSKTIKYKPLSFVMKIVVVVLAKKLCSIFRSYTSNETCCINIEIPFGIGMM